MSIPPSGPPSMPLKLNQPSQSQPIPIASPAERMISSRNILFWSLIAASIILFRTPLATVFHYSVTNSLASDVEHDKYSYPLFIPLVSAALVFLERQKIFKVVQYGYLPGAILLLLATALKFLSMEGLSRFGLDYVLSMELLSLVIFWCGTFILCYGMRALRAGAFPILFLLLAVPIPDFILDKPITAIQHGSADVSSVLFGLFGLPVLRDGLVFILPNVAIRVEKECSGIHSALAIIIVSCIAGYLFLNTTWKKILLLLLALPIVCVTNGLRIACITLLAEYVNVGFLYGNLHRSGGVIFFMTALLLLFSMLQLLKIGESREGPIVDTLLQR